MTTSSTTTFNLDLNDIIEESFERAGKELRTGYDMRTARRSLNLLTIEWANKGINLWTVEQGQIIVVPGQISYPIPIDTIDLLDTVVRTGTAQNQVDINISRISEHTYITIPTKNATGRPIQMWIDRQTGNINALPSTTISAAISATDTIINVVNASSMPTTGFIVIDTETIAYQNVSGNQLLNCFRAQANTIATSHLISAPITITKLPNVNIWPTGGQGTNYTLIYYRLRRMQDAGTGINTADIPFRLIPALVAGLSFMLSVKLEGVDPQRVVGLKQEYIEAFDLAAQEDRDKSPMRAVPRMMFY